MKLIKYLIITTTFAILLLPVLGWTLNLIKLTQLDFRSPYKAEVIRGVGVVSVIPGVIMGFLEIEDN